MLTFFKLKLSKKKNLIIYLAKRPRKNIKFLREKDKRQDKNV